MDGVRKLYRFGLPIGVRFCPNDEDLVNFYLTKKIFGESFGEIGFPNVIPEVDFFQKHPSTFPEDDRIYMDKRFFFSVTNRPVLVNMHEQIAVGSLGFWRTKGKTKEIVVSRNNELAAIKNMFVFWEAGNDGIQTKTNWVMHEFRLVHRSTPNNLLVSDCAAYRLFEEKNKKGEGSSNTP